MQRFQTAARALVGASYAFLLIVHLQWGFVYAQVGYPPRFGHPLSWSTPYFFDLLGTLFWPFAVFVCFASPVTIVAALFLLVQAVRGHRESKRVAWGLAGVVLLLTVFLDPLGALAWWAD